MAGERKGKTYEGLLKVALDRLKATGKLKGEIFWNKTPKGMTVEPDFTVGKDENHPEIVLLITHSGAAGNSHMKFWRNMGELAEAKLFLPTVPRVYNIAFDSVIKEDLKKIQGAAFDGQLIVGDLKYGDALQVWVDENHADLPTKAEEKSQEIAKLAETDKVLKGLLGKLVADLEATVSKRRPELDQLWAIDRKRKPGKATKAKDTFVRRGLSKALIFEDINLALRLYHGDRVPVADVPSYAYRLGLASKSIGRAAPSDEELLNAVKTLSREAVLSIIKAAPLAAMEPWLTPLRNLPHLEHMGRYVVADYSRLCSAENLMRFLRSLHRSPDALAAVGAPSGWPPNSVWLLEYLLELIRFSVGTANGYGYAQLAREVADKSGPAAGFPKATRDYLLSPWGHLSEWVHRVRGADLPLEVLEAICAVLSFRLSQIPRNKIERSVNEIVDSMAHHIMEAKLVTYRGFDPIGTLIKQTIPDAKQVSLKAAFADAAGLGGAAGKTSVLRVKRTIINWQSASDAGRDHKKKELCGRAVGLRYSWEAKTKRFTRRSGIEKLILVIDGSWRQEDVDALTRSGWDEILYPDEMDKVLKAII